jgi:hypothetical protein
LSWLLPLPLPLAVAVARYSILKCTEHCWPAPGNHGLICTHMRTVSLLPLPLPLLKGVALFVNHDSW